MSDPIERLKTALSDRYTIEREIGGGGMATVYLARDLKHDRKVAVKVFRPELAAALGTERFFREIRTTANLSHPHILPLHDSGEADGFLYYVMPVIEGESLRERLNRDKQLPVDDALKITSQVASALSYAHSRDIVHRDIKPANILFQAGEVVVADFGIALAVDSAGGTRLTETGFSLGTPAYMSPEQVSGEQEIDGRSDVYSLACVLYEMLAGDPPFVASHPRAVLAKHMTDPVPPLTTVRSSVPPPVAAAITKALSKAPIDRYESAKAFSDALFAKATEAEPEVKSIVVLPFENLSPDPDNAFFADGLTEELIADLSNVRDLRVISRTSSMAFKGTTKTVPTIAHELNVRYALEGSVRRAGSSLRITAQLIDADKDAHLWAEKYTGNLDDVFDLQERLSRQIVEVLETTLTAQANRRLSDRPISDIDALDCYHKASHEILTRWATEEGLDSALRYANRGLEITGDNALLYSTLAIVHFLYREIGIRTDEAPLQHADLLIAKALELDPDLPQAHAAKGYVAKARGDLRSATFHLKRSIALYPDGKVLGVLAFVCAYMGKEDSARQYGNWAVSVDPLNSWALLSNCFLEILAGDFEAAISWGRRTRNIIPGEPNSLYWIAIATSYTGAHDQAAHLFAQAIDEAGTAGDSWELFPAALRGDVDAVRAIVEGQGAYVRENLEAAWFAADCLAHVGEREAALDCIESLIEHDFVNYRFLSEINPFLAPLRGTVRFQQLMEVARQKQEAFEI